MCEVIGRDAIQEDGSSKIKLVGKRKIGASPLDQVIKTEN